MTAFATQWALLDLALRGIEPYRREPRLLFTVAASVLLSFILGNIFWRRLSRALISLLVASLVVIDVFVYRHYGVPLDEQVLETAMFAWSDVKPVVVAMLPGTALIVSVVGAFEYALLTLGARASCFQQRRTRALVTVSGAMLLLAGGKLRDGTLDVRLAHAASLAWGPSRDAAAAGTQVRVPALSSRRKRLPNVLFVLTESVRAEDYAGPRVEALVPSRVTLRGMRSVASYTAVSVSALTTGLSQLGHRADILAAPTWFDWMKSVRDGKGERPRVIYWSAQSEHLFERTELRTVMDSFVTMETLLGHDVEDEDEMIDRGVDRLLAAHTVANLPALHAPYFITLHFGGTHAPYFVDKDDAPFAPWERTVTWSKMPLLHNAYRNAIFEQDKSVAACLAGFLEAQGDSPWIIVLTSDHGESFGERGAIHHGQNLYDEQTKVPGWIAFGNGALDVDEERALRGHANDVVTHLDLLPTLLDMYGVLEATPVAPYRVKFGGRSLLRRDDGPRAPIPITNCTEMFPCPVNTWGMLSDQRLLVAQPWDNAFHCMHVRDGSAVENAGDEACTALVWASKAYFPELPNHAPNR
ncbi:LTA synthase family protein [Pendulispora rubella]|uniref:LTA synthase family protein n=1 Tax=Pendulispora rubella TaxID=2741070 RepID=A0ABZ2L957_9BACT